ncbi:hypothetical protein ACIA8H_33375 [Streptomyces goshikiensis]|uniref:hypothetical protein n=1 Tax=Streptomyces goshikiensis TaxID=1942 RepID=UPI0037BBC1E1
MTAWNAHRPQPYIRPGRPCRGPDGTEHETAPGAGHSLGGHRVHQLGPALLTVTLDAAHAQTLAVLLTARRALPRQAPAAEGERRWGAGPAETAAASLAVALAACGSGTALASGHVR